MNAVLKMRPARPEDEPFFHSLRVQYDSERLGVQFWDPEIRKLASTILENQYEAHKAHYDTVKEGWETKDNVIELNDQPIGRFIVTGDKHEIRLCDILIDPNYRGMGIGQAVIDTTKSECMQSKRPLRLHVSRQEPDTQQFYLKQGFRVIETLETHFFMEWNPEGVGQSTRYFFQS